MPGLAHARCALTYSVLIALTLPLTAHGAIIRVATYNIDCSDQGIVTPNAGFSTILQAIGNHQLAGHAQPIDILDMQELGNTTGPGQTSPTLPVVVNELNAIYGAGTYAYDATSDPTDGDTLTGNGPSGIVYNTHTISVLSATPIGTASGSGAARDPMRYFLQPVGGSSSTDFYLYVSHYKSGSTSSDINRRNIEAQEIRANADALGSSAHIIYAGDYNLTGGSAEAMYQTLTASGAGQANDPATSLSFANTNVYVRLETESSTALNARFDFQLVSGAVLNQPGLQLVPGSYTVFGNNGTTQFNGTTNSTKNTALSDLPNASTVLADLSTVTDHLPVVADYSVTLPEPAMGILIVGGMGLLARRRRKM